MNPSSSCNHSKMQLLPVLRGRAQAAAQIAGGANNPGLSGIVRFYQTREGVIVYAEISGLPHSAHQERIFGFHIHTGSSCAGTMDDPFADSMAHFDLGNHEHPYHDGDLPPLFGNNGYALSVFLTNRFSVDEVIGRVVIIHDHPDDFTTQPSGNSGEKIACGVIRKTGSCCKSV